MGNDSTAAAAARSGPALVSAVIAAGGTAGMAAATAALLPGARTGHGEEALIAWVLVALAGLGAVLCLYLAVIWGLASLVLLAGPASRTGATMLTALRVLAPRLARRITLSAAVATTATGLVLAPALAAEQPTPSDPGTTASSSQTAELRPAEPPAPEPDPEPDPEAAAPGSATEDGAPAGGSTPLPPLGWGDESAPADSAPSTTTSEPDTSTTPSPRTVIVRSGDSLWSITDDLLGPAPEDSSEIAASWPLLHDANRDVIGQDPDRLVPGQELTVPAALSPQEQS